MKLLVDGMLFQAGQNGITRLWARLLPRLAQRDGLEIAVLDRGGLPDIPGVERLAFPSYAARSTAADSFLIDRIGQEVGAEVFLSTATTTPVTLPSVLLVPDMIPEVLGFDLSARQWREKAIAIAHARRFLCLSRSTAGELRRFYPEIPADRVAIAHPGVDAGVFRPRPAAEIAAFRGRHRLPRPYYVVMGDGAPQPGNGLVFEALRASRDASADVLWVGGEPGLPAAAMEGLPAGVEVRQAFLTDEELARAYGGAEALVVPSRGDGFGIAVAEAMSAGCPVVCSKGGATVEVAGGATGIVDPDDVPGMVRALAAVRTPETRSRLVAAGLSRAANLPGVPVAEALHAAASAAAAERGSAVLERFSREWARLRAIQMAVDTSA
ncbi:glycosyltransferase [Ancylobacter lacus]|uniref:glycosyltransferase n=1 Tax=Ancylobacter lacus TaxID=2579970 RepID=UPI001BD04A3B|nr:glycosyltransferase [Ancylobacter lacus]MBS7538031.1 glycosyltransferase [Ancylobacter lacus]